MVGKVKKIHMIGNTHIDPVWLWNRAEGMQEVKSSFISALDRLDEFPDFKFTQSSISYLEWMKENCPEQFVRIQEKVEEGRWEIVGGTWVEPDCNLPSGESMIRHFLYGQSFVRENFGKQVVTAYNVDSFGHGSNLPAICVRCGIHYYLMSRPGKEFVEVPPVFIWRTKDGSSVLAERTGGEYMAWTRPALEFNLKESLDAMEEYGCDRMAVFYGVGNHGGGPTIENIRTIYEMREEYKDLSLDFSTMKEFFEKTDCSSLEERSKEMGRIFYGCYSSDRRVKELNRRAEWTLQKAEIIACMAQRLGIASYRYPQEKLEEAWKETLFNQFHDVLAGTSIAPASKEACQELEGAAAIGRKLIHNGIQAIANGLDTRGEGFPLVLINPTGSDYNQVFAASVYVPRAEKKELRIRDCKGVEQAYCETNFKSSAPDSRKGILFEAKVPAYGYAVYRIIAEGPDLVMPKKAITAEEHKLDNGLLSVLFDPQTGAPSSIIRDKAELLDRSCEVAVLYDERGAWGETIYEEKKLGRFEVTECKVIEANPMRAILRYLLAYGKSEMVIDYILEKGSDRLKMSVKLQNMEKHRMICLEIPVQTTKPVIWTETAFLAEDKVDIKDQNPEYYQHRFADITDDNGQGVAVINDSIYGFLQNKNVYKLILLRSSVYARGKGGPLPETADINYMGQGTWEYEIVLCPHAKQMSKSRLYEEADFLHMPVEYLGDSNHAGADWRRTASLFGTKLENVRLSTVKCRLEDDQTMVVRLFETEGKGGSAELLCTEEGTGCHKEGNQKALRTELSPYEIKTFSLTDQGWTECSMLEEALPDNLS